MHKQDQEKKQELKNDHEKEQEKEENSGQEETNSVRGSVYLGFGLLGALPSPALGLLTSLSSRVSPLVRRLEPGLEVGSSGSCGDGVCGDSYGVAEGIMVSWCR